MKREIPTFRQLQMVTKDKSIWLSSKI